MTWAALGVLIGLQIKHYLFDYVFQTPYQLESKGIYGQPGGLLHAGLHVLGTALVLIVYGVSLPLLVTILLAEFVIHYHLDWAKEQIGKRFHLGSGAGFWRLNGLDQLMHHLTYAAILFTLFA